MHPALKSVAHRPWPLPESPWVMAQTWHDLLFAHWQIVHDVIRKLVPEPLALDSFHGQCWIAVTPFHMSGVRARGLPALPGLSRFAELNVRTYVTLDDKPGVFFFRLDEATIALLPPAGRSSLATAPSPLRFLRRCGTHMGAPQNPGQV